MTKTEVLSKLQLNPRLLKIANLLPSCQGVADIGTDHGYIPIFAVLSGISPFAIASDINPGPVERARKNIEAFGLTDKVSVRLGAGLSTVTPNEAEVIVIAGMGGILISQILEEARAEVSTAKHLILQPMTAAQELREYLCRSGFAIADELLVAEEDKIYTIICATPDGATEYCEKELILGRYFEDTDAELFEKHKRQTINKYEKRLNGLKQSSLEENKLAADEVERLLNLINS